MTRRYTVTEQRMISKPGQWLTPWKDYAEDMEQALDNITKAPPGQAKQLAAHALNKTRPTKRQYQKVTGGRQ